VQFFIDLNKLTGKSMSADLTKNRIVSVDALRGFAVLTIMGLWEVFRTLPEVWDNALTRELARQMEHSTWEGFTLFDLIFPLFLFVVGIVIPFSLQRRVERGESPRALYIHILKRTGALILVGWIIYGLLRFDWSEMRWSSVLGRIGICYFFASLLVLFTNWRMQAVIVASILLLYWLAMLLIPVPGHGAGVLTPEGTLATYLDQMLIPGKLGLGIYDRQGVLSTFTALATTLLGVLTGHWLKSSRSDRIIVLGLLAAGIISLVAGWVWGRFFLISRNIWTSSFVLYANGWCLLLMALFYWLIDVRGFQKWSFFMVVIGLNALTIWFGQRFIPFQEISDYFLSGAARFTGKYETLLLVCGSLTTKWLFLWFLYRHRIFFKV
jgi:predicted acyltransferase